MSITIHDVMPVGLCLATQELIDARRFRQNFCDNILLRSQDRSLEPSLTRLKRELNSMATEQRFIDGHKTAIVGNIDKIISLISRYSQSDLNTTEAIIADSKAMIAKVLRCGNFDAIAALEPEFKSKVTLPVYSLFMGQLKRTA